MSKNGLELFVQEFTEHQGSSHSKQWTVMLLHIIRCPGVVLDDSENTFVNMPKVFSLLLTSTQQTGGNITFIINDRSELLTRTHPCLYGGLTQCMHLHHCSFKVQNELTHNFSSSVPIMGLKKRETEA